VRFHKGREFGVAAFYRIKENADKYQVWERLSSDLFCDGLSVLNLAVKGFNLLVVGFI
jgi:hypothetical protein